VKIAISLTADEVVLPGGIKTQKMGLTSQFIQHIAD
jgi:hypothetical protein